MEALPGIGYEVDLYGALGLNRDCSDLDVKRAFRLLALRLHPDRARLEPHPHPQHHLEERRFALAARAFEVLLDPELRDVYDLHGERALPPFHGDPCRTFRQHFGTDNPLLANLRSSRVGAKSREPPPPPSPPPPQNLAPEELVCPLRLTLREIGEGVEKECRVSVRVPGPGAGGQGAYLERRFVIDVAPGAATGSRYVFRRQGHQDPGRPPGDVVFVLEELPHPSLSREGSDLVQLETVSLREALTGCTVTSETLDGRLLRVAITDVVKPGYEKRIPGEGLPQPPADPLAPLDDQDPAELPHGDLVLRFSVQFPAVLPRAARALLDQALQLAEHPLREQHHAYSGKGGVARAILEEKMRRQALAQQ